MYEGQSFHRHISKTIVNTLV